MKPSITLLIILFLLFSLSGVSATIQMVSNQHTSIELYDLVVIAPEMFIESLQPLLDHKNKFGISSYAISVEEIYSNVEGADNAEQIKHYIKYSHENYAIQSVLLIGDIDLIPIRRSALTWNHLNSNIPIVEDVITDFYYEDIYDAHHNFSTWDSNDNGIYSEVVITTIEREDNETFDYIDDVDVYPDIMVGRLPCSTHREVDVVIQKIIDYETNTYGTEWFQRLILMGGDTFPAVSSINEGEVVTDYIASIMNDFQPVRLWTSQDGFKPYTINREINKGAGFISYSGHGFPYGFATSEPENPQTITYYSPFCVGIHNQDKLPIFFFDACLTSALDYQLFTIDFPCLAWTLVKKTNGGAIATIGATRVAYGGFTGDPMACGSPCMNACFFESYEEGISLGEMFMQAKKTYADHVWNIGFPDCLALQEFILLGDPSLKIGGYQSR